MSDYLTKDEFRSILREELPSLIVSIVTPIVHDAIKVNNEIIFAMFRSEIVGIYEEFGKIHKKFEAIDKRFENIDKRFENIDKRFEDMDKRFVSIDKCLDAIEKDIQEIKENAKIFEDNITRQIAKIHSSLHMTLNYKPVIENIDQRLYLMEQQASYAKKKQ